MTLLAGCYERFLFGYNVAEDGAATRLARSFTHAAHKGVVKCVAAAGQWAATGGADDLIHLYDLKSDKDLGFLMSPGEGAVTSLAFFVPAGAYNPTHLLSGAADGSLTVWSAGGGWEAMKTLRGHRKEVSAISVHPSGLIALTVSRDCCLRMWDLVKGRCTYTVKLEAEAEAVQFCAEDGGARYALLAGSAVTLHSVAGEEGVLATLSHPRRVLCMAWAPGNRLVTGSEDGSLRLWDARAGVELLCISRAHASRVRTLALVDGCAAGGGGSSGSSEGEAQQRLLVATASTDGSMKLWDLSKAAAAGVPTGASGGACLAEAQTRARLTCMAAADPLPVMQRRLAAAAAVRQQAARAAAAAAAAAQQGQQAAGGKKRKGDAQLGAEQGGKAAAKKAKAAAPAHQKPGKAKGKGTPGGQPPAAAAAPPAAAAANVVVHDGVVEFLDSPEQARKQKQKEAVMQQKRLRAAEKGQKYRSVPGERHQPGTGRPRTPKHRHKPQRPGKPHAGKQRR